MRKRRVALAASFCLMAAAVIGFSSLQSGERRTPVGMVDRLNGQDSVAPLLLPLVLFVVGAGGFLAALDWKPRG